MLPTVKFLEPRLNLASATNAQLIRNTFEAIPSATPHLIRIDVRSGHGSGKPVTKIIEEYSDVYAFLAHYTGLGEAPQ